MEPKILKCKISTDVSKLSRSIYAGYLSGSPITIRTIGAGALNQAIKAAIVSNKYFIKSNLMVMLRPSFRTLEGGISAIELRVTTVPIE